ncbi:MAG: hypothetical protein WD176_07245 [Pirellulales bacterium]
MLASATNVAGVILGVVMALVVAGDVPPDKGEIAKTEATTPLGAKDGATPAVATEAKTPATTRIREGIELADRVGQFKLRGDRATFIPAEGGLSLVGLENLNLERVVRAISDNPNQDWRVSGVVTEFRGGNYLLITRAIMLNKPAPRGAETP